jgi:two-component system sensor histidine kinase PilS (NtrC family)
MKSTAKFSTLIIDYLQQRNILPVAQLRRLGIIYSSYRLIVSALFMLMSYLTAKADSSLLQQATLSFYLLLSLILFGLFYLVSKRPRRQLAVGLALDVLVLSLLLYTSGAPDLQLTMLYMVVVAASFILLNGSQALVITLLAIIFVIYQQFFYAIANSMSLNNLSDALLMSVSFLVVGFLSWSVSQRLVQVEKISSQQAREVQRLNTINQEVISQMLNGVLVIDKGQIMLANAAVYHLLAINAGPKADTKINTNRLNKADINDQQNKQQKNSRYPININLLKRRQQPATSQRTNPLFQLQKQLTTEHSALLDSCLQPTTTATANFIYQLPNVVKVAKATSTSMTDKLRVQIIPLKDGSQLMLLEDLKREQASAQQLKLAALGQLTASIAHEIRNPLAAISQASQLLIEETVDSSTVNDELYQMIFAQTKRVNRIIEDVLKLSRQQPPNQQKIVLASWMPQFLNDHYQGYKVSLHTHAQLIIQFDAQQLEQILINLINNGLHYSSCKRSNGIVEVEVYCVQNDVIIDVIDSGEGVNEADLEQLFNPFFTTDKQGTGLGLYLSQAFSGANQAQLTYVDEHPQTCFRLIIPIAFCPVVADISC